jgi:hypothetical protein
MPCNGFSYSFWLWLGKFEESFLSGWQVLRMLLFCGLCQGVLAPSTIWLKIRSLHGFLAL